MPGARNLDDRAPRQLPDEACRHVAREDRALRAADEERRAPDLPQLVPEPLEVGLQTAAADAGVELVGPRAGRRLPECVAEPLADVLGRAERVEGLRARDRILE